MDTANAVKHHAFMRLNLFAPDQRVAGNQQYGRGAVERSVHGRERMDVHQELSRASA